MSLLSKVSDTRCPTLGLGEGEEDIGGGGDVEVGGGVLVHYEAGIVGVGVVGGRDFGRG